MEESFTFNKQEKLKSRKLLGEVFGNGKSFLCFPVKVSYKLVSPLDFPVKAGVGVSTRYFKHAVDRNRVKRLLRECYRLNKHPLHEYCKENNKQLAVFFLYVDKEILGFEPLQKSMQAAIGKLIARLDKEQLW